MNMATINRLPGRGYKYDAEDALKERDVYPQDLRGLEECDGGGGLRGSVEVKVGALTAISTNLCWGWMRGTACVVIGYSPAAVRVIRLEDARAENWEAWVWLPRVALSQELMIGREAVGVIRRQVPVGLVYGRSGDGAQGLTCRGISWYAKELYHLRRNPFLAHQTHSLSYSPPAYRIGT